MHTQAEFQALKPHYFLWLEMSQTERVLELARWRENLPSAQLAALLQLINATEPVLKAPDSPARWLGKQMGPFNIVRHLGSGGMAEVYLAERVRGGFKQRVALKLARTEFVSSALLQRFAREREILARLTHANIAGLIDGGIFAGQPWFAMEFVEGLNLSEYAKAYPLGLREKIGLISQMASGLMEAHRKLVIHRDLKPTNVMITSDGQVKLLDFGIGKILDSTDDAHTDPSMPQFATQTGLTPMTVRYAAPEQLAGEPTTISTDVYQLGLVFSELLFATPLREEQELAAARSVPIDVRAVLRQALAAKPEQRYISAQAFSDDLQHLLANEPVKAMPARLGYRMSRFISRNRMLSIALLTTVLATVAGISATLWQARQAQQNADALLSLLNVAAPQTFVGGEPTVGEYLLASGQQIESRFANQPAFRARALAEVGNGLINLGRLKDAQKILLLALSSAKEAELAPPSQFELLRLLADTVDPPNTVTQAISISDQINALLDRAPSSEGINALSTISNVLSKHGEHQHLQANLARIEKEIDELELNPSDRENLLRQLGKIAMRQQQFSQAVRYFSASSRVQTLHRSDFVELRVAEGQSFLAQAALGANNTALAQTAWRVAEPVFKHSYASNDPQMLEFQDLGIQIQKAVDTHGRGL